jgi:hypothetical protein
MNYDEKTSPIARSFVARLKIRMIQRIKKDELPTTISVPGFQPIELHQQPQPPSVCSHNTDLQCPVLATPRPGGELMTFVMRGFPDEDSAHRAGKRLADLLLASGALDDLGVDIGFDRATLQFSEQVYNAMRKASGLEPRTDYIGLMVFEEGSVQLVGLQSHASVETPLQLVQESLARRVGSSGTMTDRQRICAALLNDAHYVGLPEARFILCISAVEALCDQQALGDEYTSVVKKLSDHLSQLEGDTEALRTLEGILSNASRQSLRQAYMTKLSNYLDSDSARIFDGLYRRRSAFVHDGKGRGDLQQEAHEAKEIAVRLLEADLRANSNC